MKHYNKRKQIDDLKLLKAVYANNLDMVKKFVGSKEYSIPRVAVKTINGFSAQEGILLPISYLEDQQIIETDMMNPLELACARGFSDITKYFIFDLNLKQKLEFNQEYKSKPIEDLSFVFVPILLKHSGVFEQVLSIPTLWSFEDLRQISVFIKQAKWREGYQIFFKSNSVRIQYKRLPLPQRFKFIRDCLMLPYMI